MKVFFEFDTEDAGSVSDKLNELREIEKIVVEEFRRSDYAKKEAWLRNLPEKPF